MMVGIDDQWEAGTPDDWDEPRPDGVTDKRLHDLLMLWQTYMCAGRYGRGYPSRSFGLKGGGGSDFGDMLHGVELDLARIVDTIVDDLPAVEKTAIHHVFLASIWRTREPIEDVIPRAKQMVRVALKRRGVE